MARRESFEHLAKLMEAGVLKPDNRERCIRVFYDAAKVIHYKQERLEKHQLKMNQISTALVLVNFYHSSLLSFSSTRELACNLGEFTEEMAVAYYRNSVMGVVTDYYGRKIEIDEGGLRSLYKERGTGKHEIAPENYEFVRGKRLPWIRHVLTNTRSIYRVDTDIRGKIQRRYLYLALAKIPYHGGETEAYFVVVIIEKGNEVLRYLTAYPVNKHNQLLSRIEPCLPFLPK